MQWFFYVILTIVLVAFVVLWEYFARRCPKCGRSWSVRKTGEREKGGFMRWDRYEWKCKHCDHTTWRSQPPRGIGAGG